MEHFIDPFLLSPSWSELNASSRFASQTNGLLAGSAEAYAEDEKSPAVCMIPSTHIMGNTVAENLDLHADSDNNSSVFVNGTLNYLSQHELASNNSHLHQHENEPEESNFLLKEVFESTSCSGSLPHSALTISSSNESSGGEPCKFAQSLGDANSISSVPSMWPPSYSGGSSFIEQGKLQGFDLQAMENDAEATGKLYFENGKYSHLNNSVPASLQDGDGFLFPNLCSFSVGQQVKAINGGLHLHKQPNEANNVKHQTNLSSGTKQATPSNTTGCNGAAKPRVRARRGQATDPHSIAERLRREKIAERMKNLQELVPNSDKTDKASMLDEIIDYVKFLQLQVKVLSMSRLGAAGAVVPLITDSQSEASSRHLSSLEQGGSDLSESPDILAFEQEVVKLMESNVTAAMQYLQNKGLCLMPIALASAISGQKGTYSAAIPHDKRNNAGRNLCNGEIIKREESPK